MSRNRQSRIAIAMMTQTTTLTHQERQNQQLNILAKKSLPWTWTNSTNPHLLARLSRKAENEETANIMNNQSAIVFVLLSVVVVFFYWRHIGAFVLNGYFALETETAVWLH